MDNLIINLGFGVVYLGFIFIFAHKVWSCPAFTDG